MVDAAQGGEYLDAVLQVVDWPARTFEPADAVIRVDADDEQVAQRLGTVQVGDRAPVQDVEAAVGEHDPPSLLAVKVEAAQEAVEGTDVLSFRGHELAQLLGGARGRP